MYKTKFSVFFFFLWSQFLKDELIYKCFYIFLPSRSILFPDIFVLSRKVGIFGDLTVDSFLQ